MESGNACTVGNLSGACKMLWDPPSDKICYCSVGGPDCADDSTSPCDVNRAGAKGKAPQGALCQTSPTGQYGQCLVQRGPKNTCDCTFGFGLVEGNMVEKE